VTAWRAILYDPHERNFTYDADGNMTGDEHFAYAWDGENRLVRVEPINVSDGLKRVTNTYDYLSRRVAYGTLVVCVILLVVGFVVGGESRSTDSGRRAAEHR